eukprot:767353-Hanusia_phi.AAC.5
MTVFIFHSIKGNNLPDNIIPRWRCVLSCHCCPTLPLPRTQLGLRLAPRWVHILGPASLSRYLPMAVEQNVPMLPRCRCPTS